METQLLFNPKIMSRHQDVELRQFIGKLIASLQPSAVKQNSFMVNDISPAIIITTEENLLAAVISDLLSVVISRNNMSCIRISAKPFSNVVLLHINEQHSNQKERSLTDFDKLQPLAAKLGGCITVSGLEENSQTLALSFFDFAHGI